MTINFCANLNFDIEAYNEANEILNILNEHGDFWSLWLTIPSREQDEIVRTIQEIVDDVCEDACQEEVNNAYEAGYDEGYNEGYETAKEDCKGQCKCKSD